MFCIECGQELPATAKFCSNCGAKIISAKTPTQSSPILDDIASKAVDIVVMDETPSFNDGGYTDDDVRKKAAFFGEGGVPEPQPTISVRTISTTSASPISTITKPKPQKSSPAKTKKYGKYSYVGPFFDDLARVKLNGRWGFIDKYGNEFICCQYDEAESFNNGFAEVKLDGKWGIINHTGKEVISCKYDQIGYGNDGVKKVNIGSKWGIIDKSCKEILPIKYDDIEWTEKFITVKLDNKLGILNHNGNCILSTEYDEIKNMRCIYSSTHIEESRYYSVKKGNKYGIIEYDKDKECICKREVRCCLDSIGEFDTRSCDINANIEGLSGGSYVLMAKIRYHNIVYYIDPWLNMYEKSPLSFTKIPLLNKMFYDYIPSDMTWWKLK